MLWTFCMLALQLVVHVIYFNRKLPIILNMFIQHISVHLYKGPDFISDRGPKIASPPLAVDLFKNDLW